MTGDRVLAGLAAAAAEAGAVAVTRAVSAVAARAAIDFPKLRVATADGAVTISGPGFANMSP